MKGTIHPLSSTFSKPITPSAESAKKQAASSVFQGAKRDKAIISPQGKIAQMIERLTQQKQTITEQKNQFLESAMESQTPMEAIQNQLDLYNEQLETIDKQIEDMTARQLKDAQEKAESKPNPYKPQSHRQAEKEKIAALTDISLHLDEMEQLDSLKNQSNQKIDILSSEIELDKMNAGNLPGTSKLIAIKEKEIDALEDKVQDISEKMQDKSQSLWEKIQESEKTDSTNQEDTKKDTQQSP